MDISFKTTQCTMCILQLLYSGQHIFCRPIVKKQKKNPKQLRAGRNDDEVMDTGLSLYDDEEIALKLLQG